MAIAVTLQNILAGFNLSKLNANFTAIETALADGLSRSGNGSNAMSADIDLDSNDILNGGTGNFDTIIVDGTDLTQSFVDLAADIAASEANATAAALSAAEAAASAVSSAADVVLTNADVVLTNADVVTTAANAAASVAAKMEWQGDWVTATAYALSDVVEEDGSSYICVVAHTSGTFATDLAAVKWELVAQKGTDGAGSGDLISTNNLSDLDNVATARTNLDVYDKATVDLKAPLASPALTGSPTAPTQTANDNSTKIATTAYVDSASGGGGGPSVGDRAIIRVNETNIKADIDIWEINTTVTADAGADTLSAGTSDTFANGDVVQFETTTTLPAGLSLETNYYIVNVASGTSQVSLTYGGSAVDITDTGTGTHTMYRCVNGSTAGPVTIESGITVDVKSGSTWNIL